MTLIKDFAAFAAIAGLVIVLVLGILAASAQGLLRIEGIRLEFAEPVFTAPRFSIGALIGVALPLFAAFPRELVLAIAGLALFGTIGKGLVAALKSESESESALVTFLVTASGVSLLGIGSAFWGLVARALSAAVLPANRTKLFTNL